MSRTRVLGVVCALFIVPATLLLPPREASAQGTQVNALVGATFSSLRGVDGLDSRTGGMGGLSFVFPLVGGIAFQPEALLVNRGASAGSAAREGLEFDHIEVPLLLRLSLAPRSAITPHFFAGPYLALQVRCTIEGTSTDCDDRPDIDTNTVDLGGIVGSGVSLQGGPFVLTGGLRYGFGVSTLAEFEFGSVQEAAKHGGWALYFGAGLRLGGR